MSDLNFKVTRKQWQFIQSNCSETLFGGAAGGGKSFAQLIDAFIFAMKYKGSKQLILRRTLPELKRSLIMTSLSIYPQSICRFYETSHKWLFCNDSTIEFGYCDSENDVVKYQSAEYDVVRFDELTHFTQFQFTYMLSRIRGVNDYPKLVKSTTNPGGIGHNWVKERYIDCAPPMTEFRQNNISKIFIPTTVYENIFLIKKDKSYLDRLNCLDEKSKKALLYGCWDIFDGQYFSCFDRKLHVISPFKIPSHFKRYLTIDYGLDMFAALWIAVDDTDNAYVYKEFYQSDLIISGAAQAILQNEDEEIYMRLAPPDLFNRRQETGQSVIDIFENYGLYFDKTSNNRVKGWYSLLEYLNPYVDHQGMSTCKLKIFSNCINIIRTLPALIHDSKNPNDVSNHPHELTHAPDALRGFTVMNPLSHQIPSTKNNKYNEINDFLSFGV